MISDNGTNFVGADREFEVCVAAWNKERIEEHLVQQGIRWELTRLPHLTLEEYGKDWSDVAKAIYAVLGNRPITEDVLSTTMCLVEQTLNARPLIPVSSDVNDLESITPNHFLLGNKNVCLPSVLRSLQKRVCANIEQSTKMELSIKQNSEQR